MTSSSIATREARIERLRGSRSRDSSEKRDRALRICAELVDAGIMVTHARVAREARVSTWLTYNVAAIRQAVEAAQAAQLRDGIVPAPSQVTGRTSSPESLRTDLALARENNRLLREESSRLRARLEQRLGIEVEGTTAAELFDRVREVESANSELNRAVGLRDGQIVELKARLVELEAENEAKTEALRAMMFAKNTSSSN